MSKNRCAQCHVKETMISDTQIGILFILSVCNCERIRLKAACQKHNGGEMKGGMSGNVNRVDIFGHWVRHVFIVIQRANVTWALTTTRSLWGHHWLFSHLGVAINGGTPKSSIYRWIFPYKLINHPFLGIPISGNPHLETPSTAFILCFTPPPLAT